MFRGIAEVQKSLLRRRPLGSPSLGAATRTLLRRAYNAELSPEQFVETVFREVATRGDRELRRLSKILDGAPAVELEVSSDSISSSLDEVAPQLRRDLQTVAGRIRSFHERTAPESWFDERLGLGQRINPIETVGIYAPGGSADYPSSILMTAIPAAVAGVNEIIMCVPPGDHGRPSQVSLAAAQVAGVDRVFCVGGAQAIAAMALGTEAIPKVDKIAGPGNLFVVLAMRKAFGMVGISLLPGPTETLIIADANAGAGHVAADLIAQAEHDELASPLLLTDSDELARDVRSRLARDLAGLPRSAIAAESLRTLGGIGVVATLDEAVELANEYAPEHLCLLVDDPRSLARKVRNAGGVFLGRSSPEVIGDYAAGPSHVMPVGGTAAFASPLNVGDFVKITSIFDIPDRDSTRLAEVSARLARVEGLEGHARAADLRVGVPAQPALDGA